MPKIVYWEETNERQHLFHESEPASVAKSAGYASGPPAVSMGMSFVGRKVIDTSIFRGLYLIPR